MPHVMYGGVKYKQVRHAIQCMKCLDTIESKFLHDFKECSCKSVSIDGGIMDGNSIGGDLKNIEDRRMFCALVNGKEVWLPAYVINMLFSCGAY